jgi:hypothetical protein
MSTSHFRVFQDILSFCICHGKAGKDEAVSEDDRLIFHFHNNKEHITEVGFGKTENIKG